VGSQAAMNELMKTLQKIQEQTGVAKKETKKTKTEELNDFERQRLKVAEGVRLVKKTLKERDELLEQSAGNKITVELSNAVRVQLKAVRADAEGTCGAHLAVDADEFTADQPRHEQSCLAFKPSTPRR
jgi:hypothetical protein